LEWKYKIFVPVANGGFPFVVKGLNARGRATRLRNIYDSLVRPEIWLVDHSKFDSMVNMDLLRLEHEVYRRCYRKCDNLEYLLSKQYHNKFVTQNGIKYTFEARRCSGDANTSLGNSIINYLILRCAFPSATIVVDGDDSVVFQEAGSQKNLNFCDMGMETKYECVSEFQQIEFCQSRPVMTPMGWVMCKNPIRALSRMNIKLGIPDESFFKTVGVGEGLISSYMPMLSYAAARFRLAGGNGKFKPHHLDYYTRIMMWDSKFNYPTDEVRASFARAWNISVPEQYMYERMIARGVVIWKEQ